jgi:hypothetical protein
VLSTAGGAGLQQASLAMERQMLVKQFRNQFFHKNVTAANARCPSQCRQKKKDKQTNKRSWNVKNTSANQQSFRTTMTWVLPYF